MRRLIVILLVPALSGESPPCSSPKKPSGSEARPITKNLLRHPRWIDPQAREHDAVHRRARVLRRRPGEERLPRAQRDRSSARPTKQVSAARKPIAWRATSRRASPPSKPEVRAIHREAEGERQKRELIAAAEAESQKILDDRAQRSRQPPQAREDRAHRVRRASSPASAPSRSCASRSPKPTSRSLFNDSQSLRRSGRQTRTHDPPLARRGGETEDSRGPTPAPSWTPPARRRKRTSCAGS